MGRNFGRVESFKTYIDRANFPMIRIIKKRRNPSIPQNIKNLFYGDIEIKYLDSGAEADVYLIENIDDIIVDNYLLPSGKYIFKYYFNKHLYSSSKQIRYLKKLSDKNLIPKIYIITDRFVVMKYIEGTDLEKLLDKGRYKSLASKKELLDSIKIELTKWHNNNFIHNDLSPSNIIVSNNGKIWLIDPDVSWINETTRLTDANKKNEINFVTFDLLEM